MYYVNDRTLRNFFDFWTNFEVEVGVNRISFPRKVTCDTNMQYLHLTIIIQWEYSFKKQLQIDQWNSNRSRLIRNSSNIGLKDSCRSNFGLLPAKEKSHWNFKHYILVSSVILCQQDASQHSTKPSVSQHAHNLRIIREPPKYQVTIVSFPSLGSY